MGMIGHKNPSVTGCFCHGQEFSQSSKEIISIFIVSKYLSTFDPPYHNMVQNTWCVYAKLSWHGIVVSYISIFVNLLFYQRPCLHNERYLQDHPTPFFIAGNVTAGIEPFTSSKKERRLKIKSQLPSCFVMIVN